MSNSKKSTKAAGPVVTKKAPTKKAAPVRKAMPKTAKVAAAVPQVRTLGQFIQDELTARQCTAATTITIQRTSGETVTVRSMTEGIGLEPVTNFNANTISIAQAAKAA